MTVTEIDPAVIESHVEPPVGYWEREASHFPQPITPFTKVLLRQAECGRVIAAELGSLIETVEYAEIGGWAYSRVVPFGDRTGPPPPSWLMPLMIRVVPPVRRRLGAAAAAIETDWPGRQIDRWYGEWRPEFTRRLAEAREVDLKSLTDSELDAHLTAVVRLTQDTMFAHFRLHGAMAVVLGTFAFTCHDLLGWSDDRILSMLTGTSTMSTEPARALTDLTRLAQRSPKVLRLLASGSVRDILTADPEFADGFNDYVRTVGYRALTYDLSDPTLVERPELIMSLVRDELASDRARSREFGDGAHAIAEARAALAAASPEQRSKFEEHLVRALKAYPVREDNVYLTVSAPFALVRFAALELGRRLADRGQIHAAEDVFSLRFDEAGDAFRLGSDQKGLVDERQDERRRALTHPGPTSYGPPPGPPPSLRAFPPAPRLITEAFMWLLAQLMGHAADGRLAANQLTNTDTAMTGIAASGGCCTGPVRVIMDETEFDKIRAGDVLVCPSTSPAWSFLFPSIAAVVTDTGGILSHPAIVARELGLPAVVATGDATRRLSDGEIVTVDGTAGTVRTVR